MKTPAIDNNDQLNATVLAPLPDGAAVVVAAPADDELVLAGELVLPLVEAALVGVVDFEMTVKVDLLASVWLLLDSADVAVEVSEDLDVVAFEEVEDDELVDGAEVEEVGEEEDDEDTAFPPRVISIEPDEPLSSP